ncbi:MAG: tetratricopeptide repeat protein [Methylophilaceae bacterium]|jgi:tol-pal system protein YbgF
MKRILWAGLLILSFNSFAFLEDEEARKKINDLQNQLNSLKTEKLVNLEAQITDLQQVLQGGSLQQFNNKINEIFDDLAKLRGDVEVLQFGLQSFEDRQKLNYQDIESRFEKLEQQLELLQEQPKKQQDVIQDNPKELDQDPINNVDQNVVQAVQNDINQELLDEEKVSSTSQTKKNVVENKLPPLIDEEQAMNMFNDAEGLMRSTKYKEAFELFDRFITTYPKSQRLVEAKKNIGFIQFALKNYNASLKTYEKLIQNHPDHELMPEILYGKANTEIQLTRITKAKQTLRKIIKDYPNASNIESAKKRLKALESIKL